MTDAPAPHPATVADVMHPPVTTVNQNDHVAAAAYLMKRADATALIVTPGRRPASRWASSPRARHPRTRVADGKNPNDVRIYQLMTADPTVVSTTASIPRRGQGHDERTVSGTCRSPETPAWSA